MLKYQYETCVKATLIALTALVGVISMFSGPITAVPNTALAIEAPIAEPEPAPMYVLSVGDRKCFYQTINGEARNQKSSGQTKVGEVILNRLDHGYWGDTVCDVVKYVKDGTYHFTAWDPKDPNRAHMEEAFSSDTYDEATLQSIAVGMDVLKHGVRYLPRDSYNYATFRVDNVWTRKLAFVERDGDHIFRRGF